MATTQVALAPGHAPGHAPAPSPSDKKSPRQVKKLWTQYKKSNDLDMHNELLLHYLPLVKIIAERIHSKLPNEVMIEDLTSVGVFGLNDAIAGFDLERGVKFETYCAQRIRGAIFDELRSMDWVPRLVRSRSGAAAEARNRLSMGLGREPTEQEIAQELNVSVDEYQKIRKDTRAVGVTSLSNERFQTDSDRSVSQIDLLADERQVNPSLAAQRQDIKALLTRGLSRAERLIMILYYYENMTMKEIGLTLQLSESRVSQMHSSIIARLKARLSGSEEELETDEE
jgi:RNA polymerase sigma factor for flagellar operon FliA